MKHHLKNWLDKLGQVLVIYTNQDHLYLQRGDVRQDTAVLRNDTAKACVPLFPKISKSTQASVQSRHGDLPVQYHETDNSIILFNYSNNSINSVLTGLSGFLSKPKRKPNIGVK